MLTSKSCNAIGMPRKSISLICTFWGRISLIEPERQFFASEQANREATDHIKITDGKVVCRKGVNELRLYAASPAMVYEKIVLWKSGTNLKESYMGPRESYIKVSEI